MFVISLEAYDINGKFIGTVKNLVEIESEEYATIYVNSFASFDEKIPFDVPNGTDKVYIEMYNQKSKETKPKLEVKWR